MRLSFILVLFIFITFQSNAQCNCTDNFEFVYTKIEANYAGWKDKTSVNYKGFKQFTTSQRQKAATETNQNYCYKIIQDWLNYFKDHHTHLYTLTQPLNFEGKSQQEIRDYFNSSERITEFQLTETQGIEDVWETNPNYKIAIIKSKTAHRDYAGVILKADSVYWTPGQVKLELKEISPGKFSGMVYMRDHSMRLINATLAGDELRPENFGNFRRVNSKFVPDTIARSEEISNKIEIKKLDYSTLYLRMPTFNHEVKEKVDSVIKTNHELIAETPNLIIDVRNNGGGSDVTYSDIIKYLYTNPIKLVNNSIRSTPDNIAKFENLLSDPLFPESSKQYIRDLVERLKKKPNKFVRKDNEIIVEETNFAFPQKVVALINKNCVSSCEEFVLTVKQSKKVTLMGENTMGVLDYANVHTLNLPCAGWMLQYATSRTNRLPDYPIDNIGIEPDVKIPADKNWIDFALEYLKSRK
jgi:Peptidase family S41